MGYGVKTRRIEDTAFTTTHSEIYSCADRVYAAVAVHANEDANRTLTCWDEGDSSIRHYGLEADDLTEVWSTLVLDEYPGLPFADRMQRMGCVVDPDGVGHIVYDCADDANFTKDWVGCTRINADGTDTHAGWAPHCQLASKPIVWRREKRGTVDTDGTGWEPYAVCVFAKGAHVDLDIGSVLMPVFRYAFLTQFRELPYDTTGELHKVEALALGRVCCRCATGEVYQMPTAVGGGRLVSALCSCDTEDRYAVSLPITSDGITAPTGLGNSGGLTQAQEGHDSFVFEWEEPTLHQAIEVHGQTLLSGGVPTLYDGKRAYELGFHIPPTVWSGTTFVSTGGKSDNTAVHTWQSCVVYKWVDGTGQVHRSVPSLPVECDSGGGGGTAGYFTYYVNSPYLTEMYDDENQQQKLSIELYKTMPNGTTFYLEHEYPVTPSSSSSAMRLSVAAGSFRSDVRTDGDVPCELEAQEVLYTDGGALPNWTPPAARSIALWGTWIALISAERATELWISKDTSDYPRIAGFDPQTRTIRHDTGGEFTALQVLDDKLICFKRRTIWALVGEPANDLAQGGSMRGPIAVSVAAGAVDQLSVGLTPQGVMFYDGQQIWMLDRGLGCKVVSSPVEDKLASYPVVTSIVYDPTHRLVLVACNATGLTTGTTLAWDPEQDVWTQWRFPREAYAAGAPNDAACVALVGESDEEDDIKPAYVFATSETGVQRLDDTDRSDWVDASYWALDGTDDYITMGNVLAYQYTSSFSLVCWFRCSDGDYGTLLAKSDASLVGYYVSVLSNGKIIAGVTTVAAGASATTAGDYADGEWHCVCAVWTADGTGANTNWTIYVDGVAETLTRNGTGVTTSIVTSGPLRIGARNNVDYFDGDIAGGAAVYASAVSASGALTIYEAGRANAVVYGTPAGCWIVDFDSYPTAEDVAGANNGAVTNGSLATLVEHYRGALAQPYTVATSWLQLAGLQGYQRLRKVTISGYWQSSCGVEVTLRYNHTSTGSTTYTLTPAEVLAARVSTRVHLQFRVPTPKCEAMQISITTTPDRGNPGNATCIRWESVALQYGVHTGLDRVAPARRY